MMILYSRWTTHTDKTASLVRWVSQVIISKRRKNNDDYLNQRVNLGGHHHHHYHHRHHHHDHHHHRHHHHDNLDQQVSLGECQKSLVATRPTWGWWLRHLIIYR